MRLVKGAIEKAVLSLPFNPAHAPKFLIAHDVLNRNFKILDLDLDLDLDVDNPWEHEVFPSSQPNTQETPRCTGTN